MIPPQPNLISAPSSEPSQNEPNEILDRPLTSNGGEKLDSRDVSAEPLVHGAQLEADDPGANHKHLLRDLIQRQSARRRDYRLLVELREKTEKETLLTIE